MNKLFSKIAALSVGLAMAVGVGVALGRQDVKEAKAGELSLLVFSRDGTTDNYTSGSTFTKAASGQSGYYQDGSNDPAYLQLTVDEALYIPSEATALTFTAIIGGGSVKDDLGDKPVYVALLDSEGNEITGSSKVLASAVSEKTGSEFTVNYDSFISESIYGVKVSHAKISSYNVRYYTFELKYTVPTVTPEISSDKESVTIASDDSEVVHLYYSNLTEDISIASNDENVATVSAASIVKDPSGGGNAEFNIVGVAEGTTTVTITSGSAEVVIDVTIVEPTVFTKLTNLQLFTIGSRFTIVGNSDDLNYYPVNFAGTYLNTTNTTSGGDSFSAINAIEFELAGFVDQYALVKYGDKYVGATSVSDGNKLTTNADYTKIKYHLWEVTIEDGVTTISLHYDETISSPKNMIKMNTAISGFGRITNYAAGTSNVSIFTSYLAPGLYTQSHAEFNAGSTYEANLYPVNFGEEQISYEFVSGNEDVATATYSAGSAIITGVGTGETTITVNATSEHYSASSVISVNVINGSRVLNEIQLSVVQETLYVGQQFSYSGTVTAVYSDSSVEDVTSSAIFDGYDMTTPGNQTVTVSYTNGEEAVENSYTLTVEVWTGELTIGSYYVIYSEYQDKDVSYKKSLTGVANNLGVASAYDTTMKSEFALYVEQGSEYNSYAFKTGDGKYLSAANSNNLYADKTEIDETTSWTVTASDETHYVVANVAFPARSIQCNHNSGNSRFATYGSTQKAISLRQVTTVEVASEFETNYMHPEISTDNHEDTNACRTEGEGAGSYYAYAKAAFNVMPEASRNYFLSNSEYAARLSAWATANGEELDSSNYLVPSAAESFYSANDMNNNSYIIIIVISSISVLSFGLALFLRKKRSK